MDEPSLSSLNLWGRGAGGWLALLCFLALTLWHVQRAHAAVDLVLTVSDAPDPVAVGGDLTYSIEVFNRGSSTATGIVLSDVLPPRVSVGTLTSSQGGCSHSGGVVTCNLGSLEEFASATVSITVVPTKAGALTNSITVTSAEPDAAPADNAVKQPSTAVVFHPPFENFDFIDIPEDGLPSPYPSSIAVSGLTAVIGKVTVTLNNINHLFPDDLDILLVGPRGQAVMLISDAGGGESLTNVSVTLDDDAPNELTTGLLILPGTYAPTNFGSGDVLAAPAPPPPHGGRLSAFKSTNPNGTWSLFVYDDDIDDGGYIPDGWSLTIATAESMCDLALTMADAPDPAVSGQNLVYSLTVTNRGPGAAADVTIVDRLPVGIAFGSAVASQGTCVFSNNTVTCALGTLANRAAATATITVVPGNGGVLTNTASVTTSDADTALSDNTASVTTTIIAPLTITAHPQNQRVSLGGTATFSVQAEGNPPLSYQWRFNGADLPGQTNATLLIANAQPENQGNYTVLVSNPLGSVQSAPASLTVVLPPMITQQPQSRTNLAGSTATFMVVATGELPLSYRWFHNGTTALAGATSPVLSLSNVQSTNAGQYHVVVSNLGGFVASQPATLTVVEMDFGDAPDFPYPTFLFSNAARHRIVPGLRLGQRLDFELDGQPSANANGDDTNVSDDEDGVIFRTALVADRPATIDIAAVGSGLLQAWIDFNHNGSWADPGDQIFTNLALAPGLNTLTFQVPASAMPGGTFARFRLSTAADLSFVGEAPDGEIEDHALQISTGIDLAVAAADAPDPAGVGQLITYTLLVSNHGPATATAVTLSNSLPQGVQFVSATPSQGGCTREGSLLRCALGTLAASNSATVAIVVRPTAAGLLTNSVSVSAVEIELTPGNNSARTGTTVRPAADLAVFQIPSPPALLLGQDVAFQVTVSNRGPNSVAAVALFDRLPSGAEVLAIVSDTGSCFQEEGAFNCDLGPLAAGQSVGVTLLLAPTRPGPLTNLVEAYADELDPDLSNNLSVGAAAVTLGSASFSSPAVVAINGAAASSPYPATLNVAGLTTTVYKVTVTLRNLTHPFADDLDVLLIGPRGQATWLMSDAGGPRSLSNVTLTFDDDAALALPDELQLLTTAYRPANFGSGPDSFPSPAPAAGPHPATLDVFQATDANGPWSLYVYGDQPGRSGTLVGGWGLSFTLFQPLAELALTQADPPALAAAGSNVVYTFTVSNRGPVPASGVELTDLLPAGAQLVSAASSLGSCLNAGGLVRCSLGQLAVGAAATVTLVVRLDAPGLAVNAATVSALEADLELDNNTVSSVITVEQPPVILTQPNSRVAGVGDALVFSLEVTGAEPLAFQWRFDGTDLPGETNGTLTLTSVTPAQQGNYSVRVSNRVATVLSTEAGLTVRPRPTLSPIPDQIINEDTATGLIPFVVDAVGRPASSLLLTASSSNPDLVPIAGISFGGSGADRTVRITPASDQFGTATITVIAVDSDGIRGSRDFVVLVNPVNDPPGISRIPNQSTVEGQPAGPVQFTLIDPDTPLDELVLSATSSDLSILPVENIAFGGMGSARTVMLTPASGKTGTATVTVAVSDSEFSASTVFQFTVATVNDPPIISPIASQTTDEDTPTAAIAFTLSDPESPASVLAVAGSSSNPALIPTGGIVFSGTGADRTVTLLPATNRFGTALITLTASDGQTNSSTSFEVAVHPVNDPPLLSGLADRTSAEDNSLALGFTVQDPDDPIENITLTAASSNTELLPGAQIVFSGVGLNRILTLTPALNQTGPSSITVTANDGHATNNLATRAFQLTVLPVNDPPMLDAIADRTINEDAPEQVVNLQGIGPGAPGETDTLTVTAASSDPAIIPTPTITYTSPNSTGSLRFRPATNAFGSVLLTVTANDNQPSNNVVTRSFNVTINATNDPPSLSSITNRSTPEDTLLVVPFTVHDPDSPPHTLTLTATSSTTNLIPTANLSFDGSGTNRTLRILPATNQVGTVTISVTVRDPQGRAATNSFQLTIQGVNDPPTLSPIPDLVLNENAANFNLTLTGISSGAPNENQTLTVTATSSNTGLIPNPSISYNGRDTTARLSFRPANTGTGSATITVTVTDSLGASAVQRFTIYVKTSNNALPTISAIGSHTTDEDTPSTAIPFTISDNSTPAAQLTLLGNSSNPSLLPTNNIVFGGSGSNRTVTLTPLPNQSGTSSVTLVVLDAANGSTNRTFLLTVNPVNDPPTLDPLPDVTLNAGAASQTVILTGISSGATNENQPLSVSATSGNAALVPDPALFYTSPSSTAALVLIPTPGASGAAQITVTINDGQTQNNTATRAFTVNVNAPPSITVPGDITANEDTIVGPLPFTVGDAETSADALAVVATSSNPTLVPNENLLNEGIGANRSLTITPTAHQFGTATITLSVTDQSGLNVSNRFVLTIAPVNDPPAFTKGPDQTVPEDSGPHMVTAWAANLRAGPPNETAQALHFNASTDNAALFSVPPSVAPNGTLTFTPAPNAHGTAMVTVQLRDSGGTDNGGLDLSASETFTITVTPVNDPPTLSALANLTIGEDAPCPPIAFTVADAETPLQSLVFNATSSNQALVPNENFALAGANTFRSLTLRPIPNSSGTTEITITAADADGGSTNATFTLTVQPRNDPPTLDLIPALFLNPGAGPQTVNLSGISSGAPDEQQVLSVTATSSNPALVPQPVVSYTSPEATGTLRFTPASEATGSAIITVAVLDDGGTDNGGSDRTVRTFSVIISPAGPPQLVITRNESLVSVSFSTTSGVTYVLESSSSLDEGTWFPFATVVGDGGVQTLFDTTFGADSRFYRVRLE